MQRVQDNYGAILKVEQYPYHCTTKWVFASKSRLANISQRKQRCGHEHWLFKWALCCVCVCVCVCVSWTAAWEFPTKHTWSLFNTGVLTSLPDVRRCEWHQRILNEARAREEKKPAGSSIQRGWHTLAFPRWAFPVSRERQREVQTLLLMSCNIPCTLFKQSRNKEREGNRDGQRQKQGERTRGCYGDRQLERNQKKE